MKSLRNMNVSFRRVQIQAMTSSIISGAIAIAALYFSYDYVRRHKDDMYVMNESGATYAMSVSTIEENRPVEARNHVMRYHNLMFSIDPDPTVIEENRRKVEYLGDRSILEPYNQRKESGFYNKLISNNMQQRFQLDSIIMRDYPRIVVYGKEYISRPSSRRIKRLVTSCVMVDAQYRSDHNPNAFSMQQFYVVESRALKNEEVY
ncbi:MAG: hypothetical protein WBA23_00890 [Tunicatimonas sp.]|uniref:hypothetical protein n=1 Tax=Tunicatimonas sp. TaxID=1940096 RepID=UPI003C763FCA